MAKHKKYTYPQIVKIVGYKVVNKWDTGQITLGQFIEIFDKKLQEESKWVTQLMIKLLKIYLKIMR